MARIFEASQYTSSESIKVLKSTFTLLGLTILFSAFTAYIGARVGVPMNPFIMLIVYFGLLFLVNKNAHKTSGIFYVFALTGFLGFTLGPIINYYLAVNPSVLVSALAMTGFTFFGLSAYVILSGKRFTFLSGILVSAALVAFLGGIVAMLFNIPALSLAVSGVFVLVSCGFILYELGEIIHSGQRNYILATVTLYVSIYNLFLSLLRLISFFSGGRE